MPAPGTIAARLARRIRPRRPWMLIVAGLLLAVLSAVLWAKWEESRVRAERLQAEIKQVYAEAEALRTQAARAQQRVTQLERQLRRPRAPAAIVRPKTPPRPSAARPWAPVPHCSSSRAVLLGGPDRDAEVAGEAHACAVAHQDARLEQARADAPARSPTLTRRKLAWEGGEGAPRLASASRKRGRSARITARVRSRCSLSSRAATAATWASRLTL